MRFIVHSANLEQRHSCGDIKVAAIGEGDPELVNKLQQRLRPTTVVAIYLPVQGHLTDGLVLRDPARLFPQSLALIV